jgi:hypothetical protein
MKRVRLERLIAIGIVIAGAIAIYRIWSYLVPQEGQLPDSVIGVRKALALGICGAIALGVCVNAGLLVLFMNWLRSRRARRQKEGDTASVTLRVVELERGNEPGQADS